MRQADCSDTTRTQIVQSEAVVLDAGQKQVTEVRAYLSKQVRTQPAQCRTSLSGEEQPGFDLHSGHLL